MEEVFLSASLPPDDANENGFSISPYFVQAAVRDLLLAVLGRKILVFGDHPSITAMIPTLCEFLDLDMRRTVVLYQSKYFQDIFPNEVEIYDNTVLTDNNGNDREQSLEAMRNAMLSRPKLSAAVFIGGKDGVVAECDLYRERHPDGTVIPVGVTGGAAKILADKLYPGDERYSGSFDFLEMFHDGLGIEVNAPRKPLLP